MGTDNLPLARRAAVSTVALLRDEPVPARQRLEHKLVRRASTAAPHVTPTGS